MMTDDNHVAEMIPLAARNVITRFNGLNIAKKRSNAIAQSVKTETEIVSDCAKGSSLQRASPIHPPTAQISSPRSIQ